MKKSARKKKLNQAKEGVVKDTAAEIIRAVATVSNKDEDTLWRELLADPKVFAASYAKYMSDGQRKFLNTESAGKLKESCDCVEGPPTSEETKEPGKYQLREYYKMHTHRVTINEHGCGESTIEEGHSHLVTDWEVQAVAGHSHEIAYRVDEAKGEMRYSLLRAGTRAKKQSLNESKGDEEDFEMTQWSQPAPGIFFPAGQVTKKLPPGYYSIESSMQGPYFKRRDAKTESLLRFPDSNSDRVITEINKFWTLEEEFKKNDVPYRRGIMLFGSPGGGKTCVARIVVDDVVHKHRGIVVDFPGSSSRFLEGYKMLRSVHPDMPLVVLMEDIDATLRYGEDSILQLLDGMHDIHRVVWLATTNYPEKLGSRIMNRPSRFDKKFHIGMPNAEAREMYVRSKLKNLSETTEEEIKRWVDDTDGMSIAHIKELFVATKILGDSYEEAIQTLQAMKVTPSSSTFDNYMVEDWVEKKSLTIEQFCEAAKNEKVKLLLEEHAPKPRRLDTVRLQFTLKGGAPASIIGEMTGAQRKKLARHLEAVNPEFETVEEAITHVEYLVGVRMMPFRWILTESRRIEESKHEIECMECGKVFWKKLGPSTFEVKCPKCGSYDTEPTGRVKEGNQQKRDAVKETLEEADKPMYFAFPSSGAAQKFVASVKSAHSAVTPFRVKNLVSVYIPGAGGTIPPDYQKRVDQYQGHPADRIEIQTIRAALDRKIKGESVQEQYNQQEPETLDDILDNILRKMIVTGSIDAIQDVDFADETHSVYLFLDAQMSEEEVSKLREAINGMYQGTEVVASPDGIYPQGSEPADWWVLFIPQESMAGQMGTPYPPMWGGQEPVAPQPSYVPADAIADIAQGVDVTQAVDQMLKSESVDEAKVKGPWPKSKGHLAFLKGPNSSEAVEYYLDAQGELWRAPVSCVIDVTNGYRIGRWEAPKWQAKQAFDMAVQACESATNEFYPKIPLPNSGASKPDTLYVEGYLGMSGTDVIFNRMLNKVAWRVGFKSFQKVPGVNAWTSPPAFEGAAITVQLIPGGKRSPTATETAMTVAFYITERVPGMFEKVRKTLKTALQGTGWAVTDRDPTLEAASVGPSR